jgi:hypothetical protein
MAEFDSWRDAESEEEFIHTVTFGALQALEDDNKLMSAFSGSKYHEGLASQYEENGLYGNPLTDYTHFSAEDKPVPEETVECLRKGDTLNQGVALATESGIQQLAGLLGKSISDFSPERLFDYIVGIAHAIASHLEIKYWKDETDVVFFNDPQYISSVQ